MWVDIPSDSQVINNSKYTDTYFKEVKLLLSKDNITCLVEFFIFL